MLTGALFKHIESFVRKVKYDFKADGKYKVRNIFPRTNFQASKTCVAETRVFWLIIPCMVISWLASMVEKRFPPLLYGRNRWGFRNSEEEMCLSISSSQLILEEDRSSEKSLQKFDVIWCSTQEDWFKYVSMELNVTMFRIKINDMKFIPFFLLCDEYRTEIMIVKFGSLTICMLIFTTFSRGAGRIILYGI